MDSLQHFKIWLQEVSFLSEEDCLLFDNHLVNKKIKAKEYFLHGGQICHTMGFINSGGFRTFYAHDDKEINTQFSFENNFVVDYDSFLQSKPSRYHIQALEDSIITCFDLQTLQKAYQHSKNWERFGRMMAEYAYQATTQRVESFLFMDGEQRYLNLLNTEPHLLERVPLYHISSYLGLERESLSRLRKKISTKERL